MEKDENFARTCLKWHEKAGDNLGIVRVLLGLEVFQFLLDGGLLVLLGLIFAVLLN